MDAQVIQQIITSQSHQYLDNNPYVNIPRNNVNTQSGDFSMRQLRSKVVKAFKKDKNQPTSANSINRFRPANVSNLLVDKSTKSIRFVETDMLIEGETTTHRLDSRPDRRKHTEVSSKADVTSRFTIEKSAYNKRSITEKSVKKSTSKHTSSKDKSAKQTEKSQSKKQTEKSVSKSEPDDQS